MSDRNITYHWGDHTLLITIGNKVSAKMRALFIFEFLFTAGMASIFLMLAIPFHNNLVSWIAVFGATLIYLLATYRLLSRFVFSEQLLLDTHYVTIIRKTLLSRKAVRYDWKHIGTLHFEGMQKKAYRSFVKRYFDHLNLGGQQYHMKGLPSEGNMYFDADGGRLYFAPGVYSSDAERLVQIMKLYTGTSLKLGPEWEDMLQEQEYGDTSSYS